MTLRQAQGEGSQKADGPSGPMAGSERGDAVADTASERPKTTRLPERISVPMISDGHRVVLAGEAFGALAVVPCIAPDPRSRPGQAGTARGVTWVLTPTIGAGRTVLPSGWFFATRDQAIGALSRALDRIADRWLASEGETDDPARLLPASGLFADAADRDARLAATVGGPGCPLPDKRARDKGDRWRAGRVDVVDVRMEIETLRRAAAFGGAIMGPLHGLRRLTLSIDWPAANAMLAAMKAEGRGDRAPAPDCDPGSSESRNVDRPPQCRPSAATRPSSAEGRKGDSPSGPSASARDAEGVAQVEPQELPGSPAGGEAAGTPGDENDGASP